MITMSSAVVTALLAIATFLITKTEISQDIVFIPVLVLVAEVCAAILAIIFLILSYRLRKYRFPFGHAAFYDENKLKVKKNGDDEIQPDEKTIDRFVNATKEKFARHMIKEYLLSIKENAQRNESKANYMKLGQISLLVSVATIATLMTVIIIFSKLA